MKTGALKLIIPVTLIAGGILVARPRISSSQPQAPTCYDMTYGSSALNYHYPTALTYDVATGVSLPISYFRYNATPSRIGYTATLAKESNGKPNPDFDRMYALLMKGFDQNYISRICVAGTPADGASLPLTSVSLGTTNAAIRKVQICASGMGNCALVSNAGALHTTP